MTDASALLDDDLPLDDAFDPLYFLPVTRSAANDRGPASSAERQALTAAEQEASVRGLEAIASPRERELVAALDAALGNLGTRDGYFPSVGSPGTRRLQVALAAYGVIPEYGVRGTRSCRRKIAS